MSGFDAFGFSNFSHIIFSLSGVAFLAFQLSVGKNGLATHSVRYSMVDIELFAWEPALFTINHIVPSGPFYDQNHYGLWEVLSSHLTFSSLAYHQKDCAHKDVVHAP